VALQLADKALTLFPDDTFSMQTKAEIIAWFFRDDARLSEDALHLIEEYFSKHHSSTDDLGQPIVMLKQKLAILWHQNKLERALSSIQHFENQFHFVFLSFSVLQVYLYNT